MHKNFYGYQKGNVETLYTVEYIDDQKTWEQFLDVTGSGYDGTVEPWELYKKRTYDNVRDVEVEREANGDDLERYDDLPEE